MELPQAEELQDLARLRGQLDDADDADHEEELRLGLHEEVAAQLGLAAKVDELLLVLGVLLVSCSLLSECSAINRRMAPPLLWTLL